MRIDTIDPAYSLSPMAMGKRGRHGKQASSWVATKRPAAHVAHPFYARLNQILDQHDELQILEASRVYAHGSSQS